MMMMRDFDHQSLCADLSVELSAPDNITKEN